MQSIGFDQMPAFGEFQRPTFANYLADRRI
jgi:hypothetical protein